MPAFHYKATDMDGHVREGVLEATEKVAVVTKLQGLGLIPIRVTRGAAPAARQMVLFGWFNRRRISSSELTCLTRELSGLLKSGVRIERAMRILSDVTASKHLAEVVRKVRADVVGGSSLHEALAAHPQVFSALYVNMVRSGETSGSLPEVFTSLAEYLERSQELKNQIVSAIIYPSILTFVSSTSIVVLLVFVIPRFSSIFIDMGVALPLPTVILLTLSSFLVDWWWAITSAVVAAAFGVFFYGRTPGGQAAWDRFRLTAPLIGSIYRSVEVSRFARTLGTMLKGGVKMLDSISVSKDVLTSLALKRDVANLYADIRKGERLGGSLKGKRFIPAIAAEIISLGEETGSLPEALVQAAETLDRQISEKVKRGLAFLEPALILVMGSIVGVIVVSMLLAIFSVNDITF